VERQKRKRRHNAAADGIPLQIHPHRLGLALPLPASVHAVRRELTPAVQKDCEGGAGMGGRGDVATLRAPMDARQRDGWHSLKRCQAVEGIIDRCGERSLGSRVAAADGAVKERRSRRVPGENVCVAGAKVAVAMVAGVLVGVIGNGNDVVQDSVAVEVGVQGMGGEPEATNWLTCTAWQGRLGARAGKDRALTQGGRCLYHAISVHLLRQYLGCPPKTQINSLK
jgi:hypothetical protein